MRLPSLLITLMDTGVNHFSKVALLSLVLTLAACSTVIDTEKVNYKSAGKAPSLEVPPDLTQLSRNTRYAVPGGSVTASSFQQAPIAQPMPTAVASLSDVRIERAGSQRWLVVNRTADRLWEPIREFWQENGFLLILDQANLGIMETDWAENRAKLPQDVIRSTIGKVFDSLYSTGERDKFRTRLERNASGGTEIYISHRGMIEVYSSSNNKDLGNTIWQPRAPDPEMEAEFLGRLMIKLGATQEQSKAVTASVDTKNNARTAVVNGQSVVQIDEGFDRAWRRVGLSLDRANFTVEDRDRSQGIYFVRYVEPSADKAEPSFLASIFSSSKENANLLKYRVTLVGRGDSTTVSILNASGVPDTSANAQRILKAIADDLK